MKLTDLVSKTDWDVTEVEGAWVARIGSHGFIRVTSISAPYEVAVDAVLEFLDKLRERSFPRNVTDPSQIMKFCVKQARRQR